MTTLSEAREAVYERWTTQWGATTPFCFGNENFSPPNPGPWVRVSMQNRPGADATLGAPGFRRHRRLARVFIQLYDDADEGMLTLDTLAQQARAVFESTSFSGLRFFPADVREGADDGRYKQMVIDATFDYHETK